MPASRRLLSLALVLLAGGVTAAPAHAATDPVRKVVLAQDKAVGSEATDFESDGADAFSAVGRERADLAVKAFSRATSKATKAVKAARPSGSAAKRARTRYLTALGRTTTALKTFARGLRAFDPDAPDKAAALVKTARAQLRSAAKARQGARALAAKL